MNIIILLLSLLSPFMDASPQKSDVDAAAFPQANISLSFLHPTSSPVTIDHFGSLAGVSLYATEEELVQSKGEPTHIARDPWQNCLEYQYNEMSAGVCAGRVLYVHVTPDQARLYGLSLNDVKLDPEQGSIRELLGTPHFVAEDGEVYMRGNIALKVYRNGTTGEWEGVDLFDGNTS
jgi:hypothetical protein